MDQEKYTLIWHTYPEHLRGMMQDMLTSEDFADVTLVCDDNKSIMAHKNILSACSPFFKNIFLVTENLNPIIYLQGIQYYEVETIMQFIYSGEAMFYEGRRKEIMDLARTLEIKEFFNAQSNSISILVYFL